MTNTNKFFNLVEAFEDIKETLENGYDGYGCDLHNEVFNTDYYIVGTHEANQALGRYGVFKAIEEVQTYEKENFGQVLTELSNPEKLANMLYYIKGEEAINEINEKTNALNDNWDYMLDEEDRQELIEVLDKLIPEI